MPRKLIVLVSLTMLFVFPTSSLSSVAIPLLPLFLIATVDRFFQISRTISFFNWQSLSIGIVLLLVGVFHALSWQSTGIFVATVQLFASALLALWMVVNWWMAYGEWDERRLRRAIMRVIVIVLVLSAFEVTTGLFGLYEFTDPIIHQGVSVASNIEREMEIAGFVRPRLFTSEPSHLAKNFLLLTAIALLLSKTQRETLRVTAMIALGVIVVRSPIVAAGFILVVAQLMLHKGAAGTRATIAIVVFVATMLMAVNLLSARLGLIRSGQDLSAFVRVEVPLRLAGDSIGQNPFFGVGPGNDEFIQSRAIEYKARRGMKSSEGAGVQINNGYATLIISLGILGSLFYLIWLVQIIRRTAIVIPFIYWVYLALLPFAVGAIFSPRFWVYALLPVAMVASHTRSGALSESARTGNH